MSGRDENSELTDAVPEFGEQRSWPSSAAPPSFGHPTMPDQPSVPFGRPDANEDTGLTGPNGPTGPTVPAEPAEPAGRPVSETRTAWWMVADEPSAPPSPVRPPSPQQPAGPASARQPTGPATAPSEPPVAPVSPAPSTQPVDTLVAGPGMPPLDTRNAVPTPPDPDLPPPPWLASDQDSAPEPAEDAPEPGESPGLHPTEARSGANDTIVDLVVDQPAEAAPDTDDGEPPLVPDAILPPGTLTGALSVLSGTDTLDTALSGTEAGDDPGATGRPEGAGPMGNTGPIGPVRTTGPQPTVFTPLFHPHESFPAPGTGDNPATADAPSAAESVLHSDTARTADAGLAADPTLTADSAYVSGAVFGSGPAFAPHGPFAGPTPPPGDAPPPAAGSGSGGRRRSILLGAGSAVAVAALGAAAFVALSGGGDTDAGIASGLTKRPATAAAGQTPPAPTDAPTPSGSPTADAGGGSPIDDAKTDPRSLAMGEVFPDTTISVSGRSWKQDRASVNHNCSLTARGAMAIALRRHKCGSVVRATYVTRGQEYAVTAGVAVLPTKADALAVSKAGDPRRYEWFRGLEGKVAADVDQVGGYAASTVRGRYVIYSYAQYVKQPSSAAPTMLRDLSLEFIEYVVRPIDQRAG